SFRRQRAQLAPAARLSDFPGRLHLWPMDASAPPGYAPRSSSARSGAMLRTHRVILLVCLSTTAVSSNAFAQRWGKDRMPVKGACFFEDPDFKGDYFCVADGAEVAALSEDTNDKVSSIKVIGGAEVTVFADARFSGISTRFAGDVRNLKTENWAEKI